MQLHSTIESCQDSWHCISVLKILHRSCSRLGHNILSASTYRRLVSGCTSCISPAKFQLLLESDPCAACMTSEARNTQNNQLRVPDVSEFIRFRIRHLSPCIYTSWRSVTAATYVRLALLIHNHTFYAREHILTLVDRVWMVQRSTYSSNSKSDPTLFATS
jgi:hypothetical protein